MAIYLVYLVVILRIVLRNLQFLRVLKTLDEIVEVDLLPPMLAFKEPSVLLLLFAMSKVTDLHLLSKLNIKISGP
jgi:hypothetical protein